MKFSCDPKKWGPSAWTFLHSIALCYPQHPSDMDKQHYKMFFLSLAYVLPCLKCQEHLLAYLSKESSKFEAAFQSRDALMKWVVDFHNHVNRHLKKPVLSYSSAIALHDR